MSRFSTKLTPQVAGGLAAPNFEVGALSRFAGPVSLAKSATGTSLVDGAFTPEAVFPSIKLLGGIDLGKIVKEMLVNAGIGANIPNLTTTRAGNTIETRYEWATENLKNIALFTPEASARLSLLASFKQELDPATGALGASSQKVEGSLTNFAITPPPMRMSQRTLRSAPAPTCPPWGPWPRRRASSASPGRAGRNGPSSRRTGQATPYPLRTCRSLPRSGRAAWDGCSASCAGWRSTSRGCGAR